MMFYKKNYFSYSVKKIFKPILLAGFTVLAACEGDDDELKSSDVPIDIISHTPSENNDYVKINTRIQVTFSESIEPLADKINFSLLNSEDTITGITEISDKQLSFIPSKNLDYSTIYKINISADLTSDRQIKETNWFFVTECGEVPRSAKPSTTRTVLWSSDFNDGVGPVIGREYRWGAQAGGTIDFSNGYLHGSYPESLGETYVWFNRRWPDEEEAPSDVTIEFDARMPSVNKHGLKFVKMFGHKDDANPGYANVTFGLDYTGKDNGAMRAVSYGDGKTEYNDTQNLILFDGSQPKGIGRADTLAIVQTPQGKPFESTDWGTDWHHFVLRFKFNTGNSIDTEVPDGEIYVEIDGKVYVDAVNIFNRHWSNPRAFVSVALMGWSQGKGKPFTIDYDNVVISTQ